MFEIKLKKSSSVSSDSISSDRGTDIEMIYPQCTILTEDMKNQIHLEKMQKISHGER